jgi:hypothetical protein
MIAALAILAATALVPTSERPVSEPAWTAAPNSQSGPMALASNGDMALAVWRDERDHPFSVVATRIDHDGRVLDPRGIHLPIRTAEAAVWNGDQFAVFGWAEGDTRAIVFVSTDGATTAAQPIDVPIVFQFAAVSSSGANARLLFLQYQNDTTLSTRVTNSRGSVVAANTVVPSVPVQFWRAASAGRENDFALIAKNASLRLDRNGVLVSEVRREAPFVPENVSISGIDGEGFVLVRHDTNADVIAYQLDDNGAFTGKSSRIVQSPVGNRWTNNRPLIFTDDDRYIVASGIFLGNGHSPVWISEVKPDLTFTTKQIRDWIGIAAPAAIVIKDEQRILMTAAGLLFTSSGGDVHAQVLTRALDASDPVPLAVTATLQTYPAIASGADGYAVAWSENGPDRFFRILVRRFSSTGVPLGPPIEVVSEEQSFYADRHFWPHVTSDGETYLIHWGGGARRLSARSGEWIDAQPMGLRFSAAASNGRSVLAVSTMVCELGSRGCVIAQPISMTGFPTSAPPIFLTQAAYPHPPVIASNGTDYLVVWSDGYIPQLIYTGIEYPPYRLYAMRVRADGTAIDREPLVLDDRKKYYYYYPDRPSVTWNGSVYLVAWSSGTEIRGTRVTSEGAMLDGDRKTGGVVLQSADATLTPLVRAIDGDFVLFSRRDKRPNYIELREWESVRFSEGNIGNVVSLPRTLISRRNDTRYGFLDATDVAGRLVVVYDRQSDADTGHVPRVYARPFTEGVRRRGVSH